jgi:hypothetical protein
MAWKSWHWQPSQASLKLLISRKQRILLPASTPLKTLSYLMMNSDPRSRRTCDNVLLSARKSGHIFQVRSSTNQLLSNHWKKKHDPGVGPHLQLLQIGQSHITLRWTLEHVILGLEQPECEKWLHSDLRFTPCSERDSRIRRSKACPQHFVGTWPCSLTKANDSVPPFNGARGLNNQVPWKNSMVWCRLVGCDGDKHQNSHHTPLAQLALNFNFPFSNTLQPSATWIVHSTSVCPVDWCHCTSKECSKMDGAR